MYRKALVSILGAQKIENLVVTTLCIIYLVAIKQNSFFSKFACVCQLLVVPLNGSPSLKFYMRTQLICCSNHYLLFRSHLVSNSSGSIQLNKTQTHPS